MIPCPLRAFGIAPFALAKAQSDIGVLVPHGESGRGAVGVAKRPASAIGGHHRDNGIEDHPCGGLLELAKQLCGLFAESQGLNLVIGFVRAARQGDPVQTPDHNRPRA
jgi:hypothetical protein